MELMNKQSVSIEKNEKMNTDKYFVYFILFFLTYLGCNDNKIVNISKIQSDNQLKLSEYEVKENYVINYLNTNKLSFLNDTAKWHLYNIYCDDTLPYNIGLKSKKQYLAYLDLKPQAFYYSIDSSTIDIAYNFIYNDTVKIESLNTTKGKIALGVSFSIKDNYKIRGYISGTGSYFKMIGDKSRFESFLQPEIINFVRQEKSNINSWYKEALILHGILP